VLQAIIAIVHICYRPYVLQVIFATGQKCCMPYLLQAICATCHMCYRPYVLQAISATGHICCRPYVLQAICAYVYIKSFYLTNYLKRSLSFTNFQITETFFRQQVGFVCKTVSGVHNCVQLCVFVFVLYRTVLEQRLNDIFCMKAEGVAGG